MFLFQLRFRHGIINPETGFSCFLQLCSSGAYEQPCASQLMKGERCTIERPLFISSANFQLINICLHRIKKVRIYLHTLTSQQKIHWYRVEYITLFCNGFTDARSTPKRKAVCSNHIGDAISRKCEGHFSMGKTIFAFFHFEPIAKISQRMPLAEFSVPANKIGFPANWG